MAYGFNEDKSKVEMYTKDDATSMLQVVTATIKPTFPASSGVRGYEIPISVPSGYKLACIVGVTCGASAQDTAKLSSIIVHGYNAGSSGANVQVRNTSSSAISSVTIRAYALCVKSNFIEGGY